MQKVPALKPGDTVGLVATSSAAEPEVLQRAIQATQDLGFKTKVGPSCHQKYGFLSGPDKVRADDVNAMFADPEVDGIFCIRGGTGANRLPRMLDRELIKANPKVFLGYSDVTILHQLIMAEAGFCTFHGPMPTTEFIKGTFEGYVKDSLLSAICSDKPLGEILPTDGAPQVQGLTSGKAEGEIVGGCLSLICAMLGTPWEIDTKDRILVFEEIYEEPYKIDRMLATLNLAGKLDDAVGVVVGQIEDAEPKEPEKSLTLQEVLELNLGSLDKPVLINGFFGHGLKKATLPLGARALVDADSGVFSLLESGVYFN
jgi:muramoyltetrapeptide carboxypeptidase